MLIIDAANSDYKAVNEKLRNTDEDCTIEGCCGQRFIAAGMSGKNVTIHGIPGNALGEYQAGGIIIVLGLHKNGKSIVGNFPCTGMHGGKMFLRGDCGNIRFSEQVTAKTAGDEDLEEIREYLSEYCADFGYSLDGILSEPFTVITPDSKNPYKQMYVAN